MNGALDVICAGILVADCVARPVVRQPQPGRLELVDEVKLRAGGSAANTGYGLRRLGLEVGVIGRVGRDGFGAFLKGEAVRHGCDPALIIEDDEADTSASLVTVDAAGERTFLHAIGANARLRPADLNLPALRAAGARVLHVAGYFVLDGMQGQDGRLFADLFALAGELGFTRSLDTVWDATGRWERIRPVLPHTDIFCPSLSEAQGITGLVEPEEVMDRLFEWGVTGSIALKMGPDGSLVGRRDGERHQVPAPLVRALDGTGAGDAFIAGFLAATLRGMPLDQAARIGNAFGALCVTAVGATEGLRGWDDTLALAAAIPAGSAP